MSERSEYETDTNEDPVTATDAATLFDEAAGDEEGNDAILSIEDSLAREIDDLIATTDEARANIVPFDENRFLDDSSDSDLETEVEPLVGNARVPDVPRLTVVHEDGGGDDDLLLLEPGDEPAAGADAGFGLGGPDGEIALADAESIDNEATGSFWFSGEADAIDLQAEPDDTEQTRSNTHPAEDESHGVGVIDDHSAAEDMVLQSATAPTADLAASEVVEAPACPAIGTERPMPPLPKPGEIAEIATRETPARRPKRIGSGQLVPARLTWKPGDPFASKAREPRLRFRWEIVLTTACGTAACGMAAIWLLRAIVS